MFVGTWDADKIVVHILFLPQAAESNSKCTIILLYLDKNVFPILFRQGFIILLYIHDSNDVKWHEWHKKDKDKQIFASDTMLYSLT